MTTTLIEITHNNIISANVAQYVERYRRFAAKTVENILLLGQTVLEASKSLGDSEMKVFCAEVGIEHNKSTYRKLVLIGEKMERLQSVADRLPSNWTTVYEIAKLEDVKFEELVESNALKATATMSDIKKVFKDEKKEQEAVTFSLRLSAKNAVRANAMYAAMKEIADQYDAKVSIGNEDLFNSFILERKIAA